ncbi:MAG: hypothetical protein M1338_01885, partial [Patescibacteria group bacterium]|nr:hypothetical protein [Patescibacteria group bacterium]
KILNRKITLIDQKAYTISQKPLGKVFDVLIETNTLTITKLYLRNWLDERILPVSKLVKIDEKGVFFSDDVIEATPLAEPEGAAA